MKKFTLFWITALATLSAAILFAILNAIIKSTFDINMLKFLWDKVIDLLQFCSILLTYKIPILIVIIAIILWIFIDKFKSKFVGRALLKEETLATEEEYFLKLISIHGDSENIVETLVHQNMPIEKGKYYLQKLCEKEYLHYSYSTMYGQTYSVTQKGREYLVENNLI